MKLINECYSIEDTIIPVKKLMVVDPTVVLHDKDYLDLSNYSAKMMAKIYDMVSAKFSADLYKSDAEVWKMLLGKKKVSNNVNNALEVNNAIVMDGTVVTITEGEPHIDKVVEAINEYISDESTKCYMQMYDKDKLVLIAVNDEGYGTLIKYYFEENWVVVYDCYYAHREQMLLVAPYYTVDSKVNQDVNLMISKDNCFNSSVATMPTQVPVITRVLTSTYMSAEEIIYFMKKSVGLKLNIEPVEPYEYGADHEYSNQAIDALGVIVRKLYEDYEFLQNLNSNSYIKKAIYQTKVTYFDLVKLLCALFVEGQVDVNKIVELCMKVMKNDTHFQQLSSN